jgi:uncharacterized membrane protein
MNGLNFEMFLSGFMGAAVEFLEIVAIAYALARSGYVREAFWGTAIGFAIVLIAAIGLGLQLNLIPIRLLRCLAGDSDQRTGSRPFLVR